MGLMMEIRNSIILNLADAVENRLDGAEVMNDRIRPLVRKVMKTDKATDKMLKGPVADFLRELYQGIYGCQTNTALEAWQHQNVED